MSQFNALLRLGFAARLRAEPADMFVKQQSDSLSRTTKRGDGSLFFFVSGDETSVEKPIQAAVLSQRSDDESHTFLTLGKTPTLESTPNLLKVQMNNIANPRRLLFSISSINKPRKYISMHGVQDGQNVRLRDVCSKWELFHLEIIPGTIGKGLKNAQTSTGSYLTVPQAISQALLLLGVRIRLRSVHSRVLHRAESDDSVATIFQTGAKSSTQSSRDSDLIFTGSQLESAKNVPPTGGFMPISLKEASSGRYFAITTTAVDGSCAKLVDEETKLLLCMSNSPGRFHIGVAEDKQLDNAQWLMAGPRGRLELRSGRGAWETFTIEFVQQSYNVALANFSTPQLYTLAEETTRTALRSEIAAKVAVVKGEKPNSRAVKKTPSGFNHAAALSGLSDVPAPLNKTKTSNELEAKSSEQRSSVSKKAGSTAKKTNSNAQKVAAAAAASSLPRNKANRKAKKSRKKQKGKPTRAPAQGQVQTRQPAVNQPEKETSAPAVKENSEPEKKVDEKQKVSSSRPEDHVPTANGPKCAACGLPTSGSYTKAMGKDFHPQCFCCGICRRPMSVGAGQFRERGGIPYCHTCYANHLASKCARCSKPIMDTVITAMDKTWHQDCLTCSICRLPLTQTFWLYANKPNEPRCSRCVTGEETVRGGRHSSSRMVNLPGFGPPKQRNPQVPLAPIGNGTHGNAGQPGRARLITPVWPPVPR